MPYAENVIDEILSKLKDYRSKKGLKPAKIILGDIKASYLLSEIDKPKIQKTIDPAETNSDTFKQLINKRSESSSECEKELENHRLFNCSIKINYDEPEIIRVEEEDS